MKTTPSSRLKDFTGLLVEELQAPSPNFIQQVESLVHLNVVTIADVREMAERFNFVVTQLALAKNKEQRTEKRKVFTAHETKILTLLSRGLSSRDISRVMNISRHTVNTHRKNMRKKISAANTPEMLTMAGELGLSF